MRSTKKNVFDYLKKILRKLYQVWVCVCDIVNKMHFVVSQKYKKVSNLSTAINLPWDKHLEYPFSTDFCTPMHLILHFLVKMVLYLFPNVLFSCS